MAAAAGDNANYGVRLSIKNQLLVQDCRVAAKLARPEGVAEQHHRGGVGFIVSRRKWAAENRLDPQHWKEASRDLARFQPLRIAMAGKRNVNGTKRLDALEYAISRLPV